MKAPIASNAITQKAAPTPIPAFATVDRPPLSSFGGVVVGDGVGVLEELDELNGIEVLVDDAIEDIEELEMMPRNTVSTFSFPKLASSPQQAVELPQHQYSDESVPSQGVTFTSPLL